MKLFLIFLVFANFCVTINCVTINCSFYTSSWHVIGAVYVCTGQGLIIPENGHNLTAVTGTHQFERTHEDVEGLEFYNGNVSFIPSNIDAFFPNLLAMYFHETGLKTISNEALRPFKRMRFFVFWYNPIEELQDGIFDSNTELERVDFSYSKLEHIGYNLLSGLTKLHTAILNGNACINFSASTPSEMLELNSRLISQCPPREATTTSTEATTTLEPTCELIEDIFLCEAELSHLIDVQVADRTNSLVLKVFELDNQLIEATNQLKDHENRINELEQDLRNTKKQLSESSEQQIENMARINGLQNQLTDALNQIQQIVKVVEILKNN